MHTNFAAVLPVYNTKMMPNRVTLFALFSSGLTFVDRIVAYTITYEIEVQRFSWCTGLARTRPDGTRTVYLEVNQCVASGFLTRSMCSISVANVVYSNDGGSAITINGIAVGYFTTRPLPAVEFSSPRDLWNIQRNSGAVGRVVPCNEVTLVTLQWTRNRLHHTQLCV